MNRFADDMNVVDQQLIWSILAVIDYGLLAIGVLSVVVFNLPVMIVVILILMAIFNRIRVFYIPSTRELKRLVSTCRSPLFSHLLESVNGVETIRALDNKESLVKLMTRLQTDLLESTTPCCLVTDGYR